MKRVVFLAVLSSALSLSACLVPDAPFQGAAQQPKASLASDPALTAALDRLTSPKLTEPTVEDEIAAFAGDERHPLFELVRRDMAALLKAGRATGLEDAYAKAVASRADQARRAISGR